MSDKKSKVSFLDNLKVFQKIKQVKHIGVIVVAIFIMILLLILMSNFNFSGFSSKQNEQASTYSSFYEYAEKLEVKLKNVLSQIKGAGQVEVMVSVDASGLILTTDELKDVVANGQVVTSSNDLIYFKENGEIVFEDNLPKVTGVVVVSSGAADVLVKLNLLAATQTLLDVDQEKIQIFVGN